MLALTEAINDPDPATAKRAFDAMMTMRKIDIDAIEAARRNYYKLGSINRGKLGLAQTRLLH